MPPIDVLGKTKARLLAMGALMAGGTLAGAISRFGKSDEELASASQFVC
jgi:hypothetical protein